MPDTPSAQGFSMPAEWEAHQGTWLSWPKDPNTFPPQILPKVEAAYAKMVDALGIGEEVKILVDDDKTEARVTSMLAAGRQVEFVRIRTVDVWVRDYGPIYVKGKDLALVKWRFNAWGGKYEDLMPDDGAGDDMARSTRLRVFRPGKVLEGGSIDVNGSGTVITSEQCLLNSNRNPGLGRAGAEEMLAANLGADNVVWLGEGIVGDDTDGHVDDMARFVGQRRILAATEESASDPNYLPLRENARRLGGARDERGRPLEVVLVPMPDPVPAPEGRLPASHLNFYIGNEAVLVPTFGGESDKVALSAVAEAFPRREAVGVDCRALVYGLGAVHCVTQQIPRL